MTIPAEGLRPPIYAPLPTGYGETGQPLCQVDTVKSSDLLPPFQLTPCKLSKDENGKQILEITPTNDNTNSLTFISVRDKMFIHFSTDEYVNAQIICLNQKGLDFISSGILRNLSFHLTNARGVTDSIEARSACFIGSDSDFTLPLNILRKDGAESLVYLKGDGRHQILVQTVVENGIMYVDFAGQKVTLSEIESALRTELAIMQGIKPDKVQLSTYQGVLNIDALATTQDLKFMIPTPIFTPESTPVPETPLPGVASIPGIAQAESAPTHFESPIVIPQLRREGPPDFKEIIHISKGGGYEFTVAELTSSPAAIELYELTQQPGWDPVAIDKAVLALKKAQNKQKNWIPSFIRKWLHIKDKPTPIQTLYSDILSIDITITPLLKSIASNGDITTIGLDESGQLVYFKLKSEDQTQYITQRVTAGGIYDPYATTDITKIWENASENQHIITSRPNWGSILTPPNAIPNLPTHQTVSNLIDACSKTSYGTSVPVQVLNEIGMVSYVNIPSCALTTPIGFKNKSVVLVVRTRDIKDIPEATRAQLIKIFGTVPSEFTILVDPRNLYTTRKGVQGSALPEFNNHRFDSAPNRFAQRSLTRTLYRQQKST
ncbi:MAG: hypothetical protein WAV40_01600 [Microgenomates group bacterium]